MKSSKIIDRHDKRMRSIWGGMKSRCYNSRQPSYKYYGARGIKILWKDYQSFHADMFDSYREHVDLYGEMDTSIDRIHHGSDYSKENCVWATRSEQNYTKRKPVSEFLKRYGYTMRNLHKLCVEHGINTTTVRSRIAAGASLEEALTRPLYASGSNKSNNMQSVYL